jgi:hypothetical protein
VGYPSFELARKAIDDCASKRFVLKKQMVQVEMAPYQGIAIPLDEDNRDMGTIESDPDFIKFMKNLEARKNENLPSAEERLIHAESTKQDQSETSNNASLQSNLVRYILSKQIRKEQKQMKQNQRQNRKNKKKGRKKKTKYNKGGGGGEGVADKKKKIKKKKNNKKKKNPGKPQFRRKKLGVEGKKSSASSSSSLSS